jgi:hypothetical protein
VIEHAAILANPRWRQNAPRSDERGDVYARVANFQGDPANVDEAISHVRAQVASGDPPPGLEGARGMLMLVDRESGKSIGITLFDSEDDLRRGDAALNEMNPGVAGTSRSSVEIYEVAVQANR